MPYAQLSCNIRKISGHLQAESRGLPNEKGNVPRPGGVPKFSDLEVVALGLAVEALGIDSESLLFSRLEEYRREMPRLLSRRRYNDRRKSTALLCQRIHERMARWRRGLFLHRFHASSGMPDGTCQMLHDGQEGQGALPPTDTAPHKAPFSTDTSCTPSAG